MTKLGVKVEHDGELAFVDPRELGAKLVEKSGQKAADKFDELFGVQTCPLVKGKGMVYPWDAEAVLVRLVTGELTGTQLYWD